MKFSSITILGLIIFLGAVGGWIFHQKDNLKIIILYFFNSISCSEISGRRDESIQRTIAPGKSVQAYMDQLRKDTFDTKPCCPGCCILCDDCECCCICTKSEFIGNMSIALKNEGITLTM